MISNRDLLSLTLTVSPECQKEPALRDEHPRAGTLAGVREDGIELAEEEYPDPYGERAAEQGNPMFYGYNSAARVRPA